MRTNIHSKIMAAHPAHLAHTSDQNLCPGIVNQNYMEL